jgi:hypothetical protein
MIFPAQTWELLGAIGVAIIIVGFIFYGIRDGWTTNQVFTLSLAITAWFLLSSSICRLLAPSLGVSAADQDLFINPKNDMVRDNV